MLRAVFRFERDKIIRGSKLVVPLLLFVGYIGIAYSVGPLGILSSFGICCLVVFILALSIGVMYDDLSIPAIDETVYLRMRRKSYFYLGKVLVLAMISLVFSLLSVFVPLLLHVWMGSSLFNRDVLFSDIYSGLILIWLVAMSGGMAGLFANYRLMSRKAAIAFGAVFGILTIVKGGMNHSIPLAVYITWILPPIYDISTAYSAGKYFSLSNTWTYFAWLTAYVAVEIVLYVRVMLKKGFE
jgi:hypothetical protein